MTTLTKNNVIISVSVLFGLILLIWLVGFFVHRERQDPKNSTPSEPFLTYRSTKIIMLTGIVEWGEDKKSISTGYIFGKVEFTQYSPEAPVKVYLRIEGLPDGVHGFHIHEKPLEDTDGDVMDCCDKLGGHFHAGKKWSLENQNGTKHGNGIQIVEGKKTECHTGDLCNNIAVENNFCELSFVDWFL